MERVVSAINSGHFEDALIRLWVMAIATVDDEQQASRWQQALPSGNHAQVETFLGRQIDGAALSLETANDHPLALLAALDRHLHEYSRDGYRGVPTLDIGGVTYALVRRGFARQTSASIQSPNIGAWCRYHSVIPQTLPVGASHFTVHIVPLRFVPSAFRQHVSCRLSHFHDEVVLQIEESPASPSFRAVGLSDEPCRRERLLQELNTCRSDAIGFWVAPELTVPPPLQEEAGRLLANNPARQLLLAVPGSFHECADGQWRNSARVFTGNGTPQPSHAKLTQFSYGRNGQGDYQRVEGIVASRRITVFLTPLGLVGVAICKDFSDASAPEVEAVWNVIAPDWLLVPSYGDEAHTLRRHRERAREHDSRRGIRSLIANQEPSFANQHGQRVCDASAPGFLRADGGEQAVASGGSTLQVKNPLFPIC